MPSRLTRLTMLARPTWPTKPMRPIRPMSQMRPLRPTMLSLTSLMGPTRPFGFAVAENIVLSSRNMKDIFVQSQTTINLEVTADLFASFVFTSRCSSLASPFDFLECRHFLSASGLFADCCLTKMPSSSYTPSQNILESSQKWRDILEHLYRTINWWEWFGAARFNIKMTIKLWGCGKATLYPTMIDASHSLSECRIRVNSTTNRKL